jgi:TolA protein
MRTGVTASSIAHVAVIVIALIGFNHANELTPEAEQSIAVDLVPVTDSSSVRAGSEKSKVVDTKTPSIVEDSKPVVPAQPTGNTAEDQPKPTEADTPKPNPTQNSAPAPTPQPQPQPQPVVPAQPPAEAQPQPTPQPQPAPAPQPEADTAKPQPKPAAAAAPDAQLAADNSPSPDTAPPVPAPTQQTSTLEQKRAEFQKQQEAAAKAAADAAKAASEAAAKAKADAAAKAAAAAAEKAIADAKAAQAKKDAEAKKLALAKQADAAAKAADEISSIINSEKTTGAKTGQGGTPAAGRPTGQAATLSRGEMDAFSAQVRQCLHLLPNEIESGVLVDLLVTMNRDGSVEGVPTILKSDGSPISASIARAGQRAVMQCGPYKSLPAEKFAQWQQIDLTLDPTQ